MDHSMLNLPDPGASNAQLKAAGARRMDEARKVAQQERDERDRANRETDDRRPRPISRVSEALPYQSHSTTSAEAAGSMKARAAGDRQRVFEALMDTPMTDEEIAEALEMRPNTARPRRIELMKQGVVVSCGRRRTSSGRMADVWRARGIIAGADEAPTRRDLD